MRLEPRPSFRLFQTNLVRAASSNLTLLMAVVHARVIAWQRAGHGQKTADGFDALFKVGDALSLESDSENFSLLRRQQGNLELRKSTLR